MRFAHGQTVTRLRRKMITDPYSGQATFADWSDPDDLLIDGVAVAPTSTLMLANTTSTTVANSMSLYANLDVDVRAEDRIDDGVTVWRCDGDPLRWSSPFSGWQAGSETLLRKVAPDGIPR